MGARNSLREPITSTGPCLQRCVAWQTDPSFTTVMNYINKHHSKKKDANHILIPTSDLLFHICTKTVIIWVQIWNNRSLVKSKYDLRLFFAVHGRRTVFTFTFGLVTRPKVKTVRRPCLFNRCVLTVILKWGSPDLYSVLLGHPHPGPFKKSKLDGLRQACIRLHGELDSYVYTPCIDLFHVSCDHSVIYIRQYRTI